MINWGTGGGLIGHVPEYGYGYRVWPSWVLWFASRLNVNTRALIQQGLATDTSSSQAFMLAFKDTYLVSAILAGIAVLISLSYWPRRSHD